MLDLANQRISVTDYTTSDYSTTHRKHHSKVSFVKASTLIALSLALSFTTACRSSCEKQVLEVALWAHAVLSDATFSRYPNVAPDIALVRTHGNHRPAQGPAISLSATSLWLNNKVVSLPALQEQLLAERHSLLDLMPSLEQQVSSTHLLLAIDQATPWQRIVEVLRIAETAQYRRGSFVFARPSRTFEPPTTKIDRSTLSASDPKDRWAAFDRYAASCTGLSKVIDRAPTLNADRVDGIRKALLECSCDGIASIRSALWSLYQMNPQWGPTVVFSDGHDAPTLTINAPGSTTWHKVAPKLSALDDDYPYRVRFAVSKSP